MSHAALPSAIRRAEPADAPALAALGRKTFEAAFGDWSDPKDMAAYLAASYSEAIQLAEIRDPGCITLVVDDGGALGGYAQVRRTAQSPPSVTGPDPVELRRIYVDARLQGHGIGQELIAAARDAARELNGRTIWLSVWERNERAVAFYERHGFRRVGKAIFQVGSDPQSDHIMAAEVDPPA